VEAENASIGEVAEEVREAGGDRLLVRPGRWVTEVALESIDIPGMPTDAAEQIKATMAKAASGHESCLTAEQASRPSEDFFAGKGGNCRYDSFTMDGGKLSGTMRCTQQGASQIVQFDGDYASERYEMRMSSKLEQAPGAGMGAMTMAMRVKARRVGDCDAGTAKRS
jgi:hypothetical protein